MVQRTWTSLSNLKRTNSLLESIACVSLVSQISAIDARQRLMPDNYWLDTKTPCLTYGLRGVNYYEIRINGPARDLHSGVFGGTVHEPMTDLISISGSRVEMVVDASVEARHPRWTNNDHWYQRFDCPSDR